MNFSKSISFDPLILNHDSKGIYKKHLDIASQNLDDYNRRLNTHVILIYEEQFFKFNYYVHSTLNQNIKLLINSLCNWALQPDPDAPEHELIFLQTLKQKKEHLIGSYNQSDNYFGAILNIKNFILQYEDYYPLGFLNPETEFSIMDKLNRYCNELSVLISKK